jgi:aspartate/methionine/tyrosine aminotransferase
VSNRNVAATAPSPISSAYEMLAATTVPEDRQLIDVAQAVPGYPPHRDLLDHIRDLDLIPLSRYGDVLGEPELREAAAVDIASAYDTTTYPNAVAITAGANQGFCLATLAVCEPDDEVILPVPFYFNHDMWLRMNGIAARHLPCGPDMLPSVSAAAELITDRTRAIVLVTPNNPTGQVYPPELIASFYRLATSNGIYLIIDETYRDFRTTTEPAHRVFDDPCWDESVIHLSSYSKVFSITGFRVGCLAAAPALLSEIAKIADCMTICPNRIAQAAALYGLAHLGDWVDDNRRLMNQRVEQFTHLMAESDSPYEVVSAGAYFAYVRHPFDGVMGQSVAERLLADEGVLALAGETFGNDQHTFLRLAFANLDESQIPELVERINRVRPDESAD